MGRKRSVDHRNIKYGHLTVLEEAGRDTNYTSWWLCQCDCGRQVTRSHTTLIYATEYTSCGCTRMPKTLPPPKDALWIRIDKESPGGCWQWTGKCYKVNKRLALVHGTPNPHRVVWQIEKGVKLAQDDRLYRTCTTELCVNPAHRRIKRKAIPCNT